MAPSRSELEAHYEVRREAAWVAFGSSLLLTLLALVSRHQGWELVGFPWWIWLVLAAPGLLLCLDLGSAPAESGSCSTRAGDGVAHDHRR